MSNAPSVFKWEGGTISAHRTAGAALTVAYGLDYDTSGNLVLADSTRKSCVGIAMNTYASGDTGVRAHKGGRSLVATTGTCKAKDHMKVSSTPGVFTTDGTSGSTAVDTASAGSTIGVLVEDADADGYALMEWLR